MPIVRNEQDAVLASMVEGVLAVDNDGRIISLNPAAAALLATEFPRVAGLPLQSVVRNSALQRLIEDTLRASVPLEREVLLHVREWGRAERKQRGPTAGFAPGDTHAVIRRRIADLRLHGGSMGDPRTYGLQPA